VIPRGLVIDASGINDPTLQKPTQLTA